MIKELKNALDLLREFLDINEEAKGYGYGMLNQDDILKAEKIIQEGQEKIKQQEKRGFCKKLS